MKKIIVLTSLLLACSLTYADSLERLMNRYKEKEGSECRVLNRDYHFNDVPDGTMSAEAQRLVSGTMALMGVEAVVFFDLLTFGAAFLSLLFFISIPETEKPAEKKEGIFASAGAGLSWLRQNPGILWLILFLAAINLIASIYNAALPALVLSRPFGGEKVLGILNTSTGIATLAGSLLVTLLPTPKNRVKVICNTLLISMSTENFLLSLGRSPWVWYLGSVLGWLVIPLMNANLDVVMRGSIPTEMQGRVYSVRNSLQFFTIPLGYLLGGALVDHVFEPLMARTDSRLLIGLFGTGKGSGAAMLYMLIGFAGVAVCLVFRNIRHIRRLEEENQ